MPESLPSNVRTFLRMHIESYEQLELLLLVRGRGSAEWSMSEIAERMRFSAEEIADAVNVLVAAGCITERTQPERAIRYAPRDAEQGALIEQLAAAYEERPLAIIKEMNTNAIQRVRTAAIDTFADAFVLGRKRDG